MGPGGSNPSPTAMKRALAAAEALFLLYGSCSTGVFTHPLPPHRAVCVERVWNACGTEGRRQGKRGHSLRACLAEDLFCNVIGLGGGEVCVPLRHLYVLVPHPRAHLVEADACLDQPRRERVTKRVERHIFEACRFGKPCELFRKGVGRNGGSVQARENTPGAPLDVVQGALGSVKQRNHVPIALGEPGGHDNLVIGGIDVLPLQANQRLPTKAGSDGNANPMQQPPQRGLLVGGAVVGAVGVYIRLHGRNEPLVLRVC